MVFILAKRTGPKGMVKTIHCEKGDRNRIKAKKTVWYGTSQIVQWTIHHSSNRNPKESRFSYLERSCLGFGLVAFLVLGSLQIDT